MGLENPVHLIFIGAVALIVLGPKRLPEIARALGNGIREFRESVSHDPTAHAPPTAPYQPVPPPLAPHLPQPPAQDPVAQQQAPEHR
ncbi:MAG: Sec-independent protein translocase subunit TatA/TatB [Solirubrobacteraceae bacterium]